MYVACCSEHAHISRSYAAASRHRRLFADQVVACTRSTEEQTRLGDAAIARSLAEQNASAEDCEGLQKELGCVEEDHKKLEQEITKLKVYAVKRAQHSKLNKA